MRVAEGDAVVEDVDRFVERVAAAAARFDCAATAFDARYVAGRRHLEAAVERANRAVDRDDAIADDRSIEVLLYAAGRRQIERALEMGVDEGEGPVVVAVDGPEAAEADGVAAVEGLLQPRPVLQEARDEARIRAFFGITDAELGATDASLEDLVIERVSLLAVEK